MKRVLVASMHHESNSFNPIVAGEKDFHVRQGADSLRGLQGNDPLFGIVKTLRDRGYEVVPTLAAGAVPNGEVDRDFYLRLKSEILRMARQARDEGPIDAVTLDLHGSMRIKELGDAEGYLLEELREIFPDIPLFCALDMHTTMTRRMHENCDGFVGYKCAPHTDRFETGVHAARMTIAALEEGVRARSAWVKIPLLIAGEQSSTTVQPMIDLINALRETEKQEGVLAASYLMGFPWCDNEDSSAAVYVTADSQDLAEREALRLAELMWGRGGGFCFQTETYPEAEALDTAFRAVEEGHALPIYLSDSGDNPTAGSSSDCTGFLKRIMDDPRTDKLRSPVLFGGIYDPEATRACRGRVGQKLTLRFGAAFDQETTRPITAEGTVMAYLENWEKSPLGSDLALFRTCGVDIVLAEEHIGYTFPDVFAALGRDPGEADIVVCKLGYLTDAQAAVAKRSIMALSKGSTNEDLRSLHYTKVPRPIFPLDSDFTYVPEENLIRKR